MADHDKRQPVAHGMGLRLDAWVMGNKDGAIFVTYVIWTHLMPLKHACNLCDSTCMK